MDETNIRLDPIGTVRNGLHDPTCHEWTGVVSEIVLRPEMSPALDGLEDFSHVLVLFWLDKVKTEERKVLKAHWQRRRDLPLVGVFCTRTPSRPNPIGVTVARVLERRTYTLRVQGLDAIDGTPVLDIKPFLPVTVPLTDIRLPEWLDKVLINKS